MIPTLTSSGPSPVAAGQSETVRLGCPNAGGVLAALGGGAQADGPGLVLDESYPEPGDGAWTVVVTNTSTATLNVTTYATCAS